MTYIKIDKDEWMRRASKWYAEGNQEAMEAKFYELASRWELVEPEDEHEDG